MVDIIWDAVGVVGPVPSVREDVTWIKVESLASHTVGNRYLGRKSR